MEIRLLTVPDSLQPAGLLILDGKYLDSKSADKVEEVCTAVEQQTFVPVEKAPHISTKQAQGAYFSRSHGTTSGVPALDHRV